MSVISLHKPFLFVGKENLCTVFILLINGYTTTIFTHLFYNGHKHIVVFLVKRNQQFLGSLLLKE